MGPDFSKPRLCLCGCGRTIQPTRVTKAGRSLQKLTVWSKQQYFDQICRNKVRRIKGTEVQEAVQRHFERCRNGNIQRTQTPPGLSFYWVQEGFDDFLYKTRGNPREFFGP